MELIIEITDHAKFSKVKQLVFTEIKKNEVYFWGTLVINTGNKELVTIGRQKKDEYTKRFGFKIN